MPLTPDQIANYSENELRQRARQQILGERKESEQTYVSPHFGDGRSATQPGALWFDPRKTRPMGDHVVIELDTQSETTGLILLPETAVKERGTRTGTVLTVGPGKWNDKKFRRDPMTLKPGDRVVIGPYADWESWDAWAAGNNVVLCQEADVRVRVDA